MSDFYPFRKTRSIAKRKAKPSRVRDRVRLYGKDKIKLRQDAFERSGGRCEEDSDGPRCGNDIFWNSFHLSHRRHGHRKTDTLDGCIASCPECHIRKHNAGGNPVPRRPGRVMKKTEALDYLQKLICFCGAKKAARKVFCEDCWKRLSAQTRMDLERLTNKEWLQAVSRAETELLSAFSKQ